MTTFNLTLSELRQIYQAGDDIRETVEDLNDQPEWLLAMGGINNLAQLQDIYKYGCESGAFMPACKYHTAKEVMSEYGGDVLEFISDCGDDLTISFKEMSWSQLASKFLCIAVEIWVRNRICDYDLDGVEV